jgi:hypothetical protein
MARQALSRLIKFLIPGRKIVNKESAVGSTEVKILRQESMARTWIRLLKPVEFTVVGVRRAVQCRAGYARKRISRRRPHGVRPLFTLSYLPTPAPLGSRQMKARPVRRQ